jgi:hypothetical protein
MSSIVPLIADRSAYRLDAAYSSDERAIVHVGNDRLATRQEAETRGHTLDGAGDLGLFRRASPI